MWRRGVSWCIRLEGLMVNNGLKGWWLMAILKSEQLQKVFHNTQGMGIFSNTLLSKAGTTTAISHQPWQTVHLNWHNLIHSLLGTIVAYKGKSSKQGVNTTMQFPARNKTCGGGQACGCAKLPFLVWGPPGDGEPSQQWKEVATRINVWPVDKPAFVSKRATVHSHWAQTLLLGIVLSPAVILVFQTRTYVQQQLAGDHWPNIKHHHSTTPSWVWCIVVAHITCLSELKSVGGCFFSYLRNDISILGM